MIKSLTGGRELILPEQLHTDKATTVCFTGHREKSIPPYNNLYQNRDITFLALKIMLSRYIDIAIEDGYKSFISGFAEGVDLWAASYIIEKKKSGADISLIGAIPYLHHADRFSSHYHELLKYAEQHADAVVLTNPNPDIIYSTSPKNQNQSKNLYRDRNYFMVDNSSALIAFMNENTKWSGTFQTINYARKNELQLSCFGLEDIYELLEQSEFSPELMKKIVNRNI